MSKRFTDKQGLTVTAPTAAYVDAINHYSDIIFRKKQRFVDLLASHNLNDNQCPMLLIYRAISHFFSFSQREIHNQLAPILTTMATCNLNAREQLYYQALQQCYNNDLYGARDQFSLLVEQFPQDKVATLLIKTTAFLTGKIEILDKIYQQLIHYHREDVDFLGYVAFYYAHVNRRAEARTLLEKCLQQAPYNAWLHHVYAHTLDEGDPQQVKAGIAFLQQTTDNWPKQNRFFEGHNWMHLCILYLKAGERIEQIETIYNQHIWKEAKTLNFERNNAFMTLWSLELFGHRVSEDKWHDLASYAEANTEDYCSPYLTIITILMIAKVSFARAMDYRKKMEIYSNQFAHGSEAYTAWHDTALALLDGCLAYVAGDYPSAAQHLSGRCSEIATRPVGHSNEQRAIFAATAQFCLDKQATG
ncbi:MAG: hypothetical protein GY821_08205 [Gammaproteobacteria bacterium]|nr:hypothetical protein [Gammaproteobacteria bacterium]